MKKDREQFYNNDIWESEFHDFNKDKITVDIAIFPILIEYIKDILILLKIKRKAKIKKCQQPNCNNIQVKCPYCQNISMQEQITRNYFCLVCHKKSYIVTSVGLSSYLLYKAYNIPRNQQNKIKKIRGLEF